MRGHVDSRRFLRLAEQMRDKRYRDAYVASHTRQMLARQMRKFRGSMSQTEFAEILGKRQTVISRLENPSYSGWTLRTLFEVAKAINVAVFVRFVDFPTFLKYSDDISENTMNPKQFNYKDVRQFAHTIAIAEFFSRKGGDVLAGITEGQPKSTSITVSRFDDGSYFDVSRPHLAAFVPFTELVN